MFALADLGTCDTCGDTYPLGERAVTDDTIRCGDCGNCSECCEHLLADELASEQDNRQFFISGLLLGMECE